MIEMKIGAKKMLRNLSPEQREQITRDLTIPNPAYIEAVKRNAFNADMLPQNLYYYKDTGRRIAVPRGYNVPYAHRIIADERLTNDPVDYPPFRFKLRETQQEAFDAYVERARHPSEEQGILILPTGKGKSILGLYLAGALKQRALIVVQKNDLVSGWTKDAHDVFGFEKSDLGIIKADKFILGEHLTITTIQTLMKLPAEKRQRVLNHFGMLIQDEMHHAAARSYDILQQFPARYKIGLTATLLRNDGLLPVLHYQFGDVAFEHADHSGDDDILPVTVRVRQAPTQWTSGKKKVHIHEVRQAIAECEHYGAMLTRDILREYGKAKSCVVFAHTKEHCDLIFHRLLEAGVPGHRMQIYNGDSKVKPEEMKERAESRQALITIATYAIATEGTNVKAWERGYLASSVANEKDVIQSIGRCRRTMPGKKDCLIYDYRFDGVANCYRHGMLRDKVYHDYGFETVQPTRNNPAQPRKLGHVTGRVARTRR